MWRAFMDEALPYVENRKFIAPEPLPENTNIMITGDWQAAFAQAGGAHSILHFVNKANPRGITPIIPGGDSQYSNWEYSVQMWAAGVNLDLTSTSTNTTTPRNPLNTNTVNMHTLQISNPAQGTTVVAGVPLTVRTSTPIGTTKVEYFLNGVYLGASTKAPFSITIVHQRKSSMSIIKAIGHISNSGTIVGSTTFNTQ